MASEVPPAQRKTRKQGRLSETYFTTEISTSSFNFFRKEKMEKGGGVRGVKFVGILEMGKLQVQFN